MPILKVIILAIVQGLAELLPVSSSAHVVVAEKLLGLDPSSPPMTLLLVMLHMGTMFAVIVYFWRQWRSTYFISAKTFKAFAELVFTASALTVVVGEIIIKVIEQTLLRSVPNSEIEDLFSHLEYIAPALAVAGVLILSAGLLEKIGLEREERTTNELAVIRAGFIGIIQGLCLPFRGLSRSGATISTGMLLGIARAQAESFSFALAIVITPPAIGREVIRLVRATQMSGSSETLSIGLVCVLGAVVAFFAGLLALKWLSAWLESGRWYLFGIYCLFASAAVTALYRIGY
jgi:undecaprenyl-diphosphatase